MIDVLVKTLMIIAFQQQLILPIQKNSLRNELSTDEAWFSGTFVNELIAKVWSF